MLTSEKNRYFVVVQQEGLDPATFTVGQPDVPTPFSHYYNRLSGWRPAIRIHHQSPLVFDVYERQPHVYAKTIDYQCFYNIYSRPVKNVSQIEPDSKPALTCDEALTLFASWLRRQVKPYNEDQAELLRKLLDERNTPDLWQMAHQMANATHEVSTIEAILVGADFTDAMSAIREFIRAEYAPTLRQLVDIDRNLESLRVELKRRPTTDWPGLVIGTIVTVVTALYLSNEQGRQLLELVYRAIQDSLHLLR